MPLNQHHEAEPRDCGGGLDISNVQDFGFSTVVEYKGKTILFDAGTDAERVHVREE